eukprot:UN09939
MIIKMTKIQTQWFNNKIRLVNIKRGRELVCFGALKKTLSLPFVGLIGHRKLLFILFTDMLLWCIPPRP